MKKLLNLIKKHNLMAEIEKTIFKHESVYINNTNEENALLVMLSYFYNHDETIFLVTPNLYKAQLLYDKLSQVMDKEDLCFFPQDEFITNELLVSSMEFRVERINTIKRLLHHQRRIVVANLYGMLKPELSYEHWQASILNLKTNHDYAMDELSEKLLVYGYKKEYIVEKMGDFSVRGGIIDIFPLGAENPYRLDFFGDTIDVIKTFDIETQRSIEKIDAIEIMPIVEFFYTEKEYNQLYDIVQTKINQLHFSDETIGRLMNDLEHLKNHDELDRLIRYLPFLTEQHYTIKDYSQNKHLFLFDFHRLNDQNNILIEEIKEWYMSTDDYPKMSFSMIYDFNELLLENGVYIDYLDYQYKDKFQHRFSVFGKEPMIYSQNLDLLYRELVKNLGQKTQVIAFPSEKGRQKFSQVLAAKQIDFEFISKTKALKEYAINLVVSDQIFDVVSDSFEVSVMTEEALTKKHLARRRGDYISVYRKSERLSSINDLKQGDYVVHYDYGIGRFLEIKTMTFGNAVNDYIHIEYRDGDKLYVSLDAIDQVHKYSGSEGFSPRLSKLGGKDWSKTKNRVRDQVREIADQLIRLYAQREHSQGFVYDEYPDMEEEFVESFPYQETEDQIKAINDVLKDMSSQTPMDRLICGDVGFGKTEIALRATFRAVLNGKQVAYLAPTTVLSKQHYHTFKERMDDYGINVVILNRFVTKAHQRAILKQLKEGIVDVLIGTHRILSKDVEFKDLGLLVIDEEQRFGVLHKERIKEMKVNVDVLSLSATPIPRTLHMAIMGVKNMSLLETAPKNRYPIQTYVLERNDVIIKDAIERELARNGQVFYLYNRVEDIDLIADKIAALVPEANIDVVHGKMHKSDLERVVDNFIEKEIDILISTTIIETGIDIPNANTLIVHDADKMGLSQLYQIRGRVGRSDKIAYAYLMYKKNKILTEEAEKRLQVIKEFTELGSGFKIAVRDLSIRGAGDVLGREQSGFIDSVGIDMYMKILEEEISRTDEDKKIEKLEKGVKAHVSRFIDKKYIEDDFVKIEMHKKIKNVHSLAQANDLMMELIDRFGDYDPRLEIYVYEKLFEYYTKQLNVEKISENKTNVTLIVSEKGSRQLAGDKLFQTGLDISPLIRFSYKRDRIHIILDTVRLEKHWLYTMVDFLEKIVKK